MTTTEGTKMTHFILNYKPLERKRKDFGYIKPLNTSIWAKYLTKSLSQIIKLKMSKPKSQRLFDEGKETFKQVQQQSNQCSAWWVLTGTRLVFVSVTQSKTKAWISQEERKKNPIFNCEVHVNANIINFVFSLPSKLQSLKFFSI